MSTGDFDTKGTFADVVLPALLVQAMNQRFTGMFRAERESIIKVIYFKEGDIAFASSNQPSDRLGEVLIKRGQLTREQLDMAMSKLEANVSLGRMLVELGYLSPKELLAGAKAQVEEILYSLNTWREGTYEFVEGPLAPRIVDLKLNMRQVVFQSIMQLEDRGWVLQQIGSMETVFAPGPDLTDALQTMRLEPETQEVISNIDGHNTVRDLCSRSSLDEFTVTKAAAAVYQLNLVHVTTEATGQGEFLSPFGHDTEQASAAEASSAFSGSGAASETVPGFAPFAERQVDDSTQQQPAENYGSTTASLHVPDDDEPTEVASPAGDEELSYEEEDSWDDEDEPGSKRRWLVPAVALLFLGVVGGAAWQFRDRLPFIGGGGSEVAQATPPKAARTPARKPTPKASAAPVLAGASPVAGATPSASTPVVGATPATGSMTPAARPTPAPTAVAAIAPPRTTPRSVPAPPVAIATPRVPASTPAPPARTPVPQAPTPQPTRIARSPINQTPPIGSAPSATPDRRPPTRGTGLTTSDIAMSSPAQAARANLERGDFNAAASSFQQAVAGHGGYSLQLEIICQAASVRDGWSRADGAKDYLLLPFQYRGRSCYRVLWGVYDTRAAAQAGNATVPSFFRSQLGGRSAPVVRLTGR